MLCGVMTWTAEAVTGKPGSPPWAERMTWDGFLPLTEAILFLG
jgi:hypothetical protein